jgi:hypothetical protein
MAKKKQAKKVAAKPVGKPKNTAKIQKAKADYHKCVEAIVKAVEYDVSGMDEGSIDELLYQIAALRKELPTEKSEIVGRLLKSLCGCNTIEIDEACTEE